DDDEVVEPVDPADAVVVVPVAADDEVVEPVDPVEVPVDFVLVDDDAADDDVPPGVDATTGARPVVTFVVSSEHVDDGVYATVPFKRCPFEPVLLVKYV